MTRYSKFNIVYWLQKWMDSVPGQTFLNYAYSWGASIVILGTLFKLTHIEGANLMLFIGMGTEVFVFFISAFDRPFDKTTDGMDLQTHYAPPPAPGVADNSDKTEESDLEDEESDGIILGGSDETEEQQQGQAAAATVEAPSAAAVVEAPSSSAEALEDSAVAPEALSAEEKALPQDKAWKADKWQQADRLPPAAWCLAPTWHGFHSSNKCHQRWRRPRRITWKS